jgi:hypothetical protein
MRAWTVALVPTGTLTVNGRVGVVVRRSAGLRSRIASIGTSAHSARIRMSSAFGTTTVS